MNTLLSFHNDEKIKQKYVERLEAHAKADEFIKGGYWENGKGCAVGCTIHSDSHRAYETELGIPEWLARLEDVLFEGLDNRDAKTFAVDFLISIPVGVDLNPIKWKFCAYILKENIDRVLKLKIDDKLKQQVVEAVQGCLKINEDAIRSGKWDDSAAKSAESAAWSAAWSAAESAAESAAWSAAKSAKSAAWSAAESAAAWSAASAASAWSAAAAAAESAAWSAAKSAAWSAAFKRYADELLRLLRTSKVVNEK